MVKKYFLILVMFCFCNKTAAQKEFWGTVASGGDFGYGYIYKTDSTGNNLQVVYSFNQSQGDNPGAIIVSGNKLYGVTNLGGQYSETPGSGGTFYEYDLTTNTFALLQSFGSGNTSFDGVQPIGEGYSTLTEVSPGIIYGQVRAYLNGTKIFSWNAQTGIFSTALMTPPFQGDAMNVLTGTEFAGELYKHTDGYLYGTTATNSTCPIARPYMGSIIRIDPMTNAFSIRYLNQCSAENGYRYKTGFVSHNGLLYSVATSGGTLGKGVIYSFNPSNNVYSKKYEFTGGVAGSNPSTMTKGVNGKFYGVNADGGLPQVNLPNGGGTLFEFDPATDSYIKKLDFLYENGNPAAVGAYADRLINGHDNKLYGTARNGIFEYDPTANTVTAAGRFTSGNESGKSIIKVCRKPSYIIFDDIALQACAGSDFSYVLNSDNTDNYSWSHNGLPVASQTSAVLSFTAITESAQGIWTCTLTNECGSTVTQSLTISVAENPPPIVTQNQNELISTPAFAYQWIKCGQENVAIEGATSQNYAPGSDGNYAVSTTQANNCIATSNCFAFTSLGLSPFAKPKITILPNPASNSIQIITDQEIRSGDVYNMLGQKVLQTNSASFDITLLPAGNYFIKLKLNDAYWHGRFIKK